MINVKKKGNKAEREVAYLLTKWSGIKFYRTPSSGGLHWVNRIDTVGDIICEDLSKMPFSVEVKFHKELDFDILKQNIKYNKIKLFWDQALTDSVQYDKLPLLFFRINNMAKGVYYVILHYNIYKYIKNHTHKIKEFKPYIFYRDTDLLKSMFIIISTNLFKIDYNEFRSYFEP